MHCIAPHRTALQATLMALPAEEFAAHVNEALAGGGGGGGGEANREAAPAAAAAAAAATPAATTPGVYRGCYCDKILEVYL